MSGKVYRAVIDEGKIPNAALSYGNSTTPLSLPGQAKNWNARLLYPANFFLCKAARAAVHENVQIPIHLSSGGV